jgi:hypothetical protein
MKSFKKIALAMVAAMTMGTLIATPASAAVMTVAVDLNSVANTTASSSATPAALPVPADNKIDVTDALRFVATVDTGTSVTVTATNATIVTALHTVAAPVSASSGSSSITIATGTGTTATFYVYTKTTAVGTVVVTNQGTTLTYYVQGTAGLINNLTVSAPANGAAGTKQDIVVSATDVFGNKISGKSLTATVFAGLGTLDSATATTGATLSDFGQATFKLTLPATGTRSLVTFAPTTAAEATSADVVGLTARTLSPFAEIAVRDLLTELADAKAALAAEKAAREADKVAADKAAADAKAAADKAAADAKLASDTEILSLKSEIVTLKADAVTAKVAADKALSDLAAANAAELDKVKADNAAALAAVKVAFNKLAKKWNKKNPKAKVALIK